MANGKDNLYHLIPTAIIVALVLILAILIRADSLRESKIETTFTDTRIEIADDGITSFRKEIDKKYDDLLSDCESRAEYDRYIDMDSRTMTAVELREALTLHEECGLYLSNKANLTLGFFETKIDTMRFTASLLSQGQFKRNAEQLVTYWENIYEAEAKHTATYRRLVGIQEDYWLADLNKAIKLDSSEEREAKVGALNYEANQKLELVGEILEDIRRLKAAESTLWNDFFATSSAPK